MFKAKKINIYIKAFKTKHFLFHFTSSRKNGTITLTSFYEKENRYFKGFSLRGHTDPLTRLFEVSNRVHFKCQAGYFMNYLKLAILTAETLDLLYQKENCSNTIRSKLSPRLNSSEPMGEETMVPQNKDKLGSCHSSLTLLYVSTQGPGFRALLP